MNSLLLDGIDPERDFNEKGSTVSNYSNYLDSCKEKIEYLKKTLADLGEDALQKHPEILRKLASLTSLRLAVNSGDEGKMAAKFKDSNLLIKWHATIAETQILLSEKLSANLKQK